jgi:hypothetical protein
MSILVEICVAAFDWTCPPTFTGQPNHRAVMFQTRKSASVDPASTSRSPFPSTSASVTPSGA